MEIVLTALVAALAAHHLVYAAQNLVNLDAARGFVAVVLAQDDAPAYPRSIMPALRHPLLVRAVLTIIIGFEIAAGALLGWGAVQMLGTGASPAGFAAASEWAILGCGVALVLWFGLFLTIAAALFQMWQMELGEGAMRGAFYSATFTAVVLFLLLMHPQPGSGLSS